MNSKQRLLARLDAVARAVKQTGQAIALLGLGSAGRDLARLDAYSDLDFFVIVQPGSKSRYLSSLDWLARPAPIVFSFQNTADGFKLLYNDGIFCEMAVFEPQELPGIPYDGARIIWQAEGSALIFPTSNRLPPKPSQPPTQEWLIGEILCNLYIGLGRFQRGEKLTAARFIQGYAVDHLLKLAPFIEEPRTSHADAFDGHRRFEQRFPKTAAELPHMMQGYDKSPHSARAILDFLEDHFAVNAQMKDAITKWI
ncbi:MAG: hypothetical protein R3293_24905 [Candidatus Promineifilaceae bacterium]|nr:hypothetical protein [Candidatus Promineifilaceae bacterium]